MTVAFEKKYDQSVDRQLYVALLMALVLPVLVGLFALPVVRWVRYAFWLVLFILPLLLFCRMMWDWLQYDDGIGTILLRYLRPVPPGAIYSSELRLQGWPLVTMGIIAVNALVHAVVPDEAKGPYLFFPEGETGTLQIMMSVFTSAFLHGDWSHILFNMLFLWGFGSALENRIGRWRFAGFYGAAIVGSNLLVYLLLVAKARQLGAPQLVHHFHSLGASGAVAGIMGLYIVRCFFARISFSAGFSMLPVLWPVLALFSFPIRIQAPVLVGLFFLFDVGGSVIMYGQRTGVNYWAHVGGYLTGMLVGLLLGLHRQAALDAAKTRAMRHSEGCHSPADAETDYQRVLAAEPANREALAYLFERHHQRESAEAGAHFHRLLEATAVKDLDKAVDLCREYLPRYLAYISPPMALRIGSVFYRNTEFARARYCLERAAEADGPWQPKAMLMLARTFGALDNGCMARELLASVASRFNGSLFETEARRLAAEWAADDPLFDGSAADTR